MGGNVNNIFTPGFPGKIICQYNRHRLADSIINQALRTHPLVIIENCVYHNAFYEAPVILNDRSETSRPGLKLAHLGHMEMQIRNESNYSDNLLSGNNKYFSPINGIIQILGSVLAP